MLKKTTVAVAGALIMAGMILPVAGQTFNDAFAGFGSNDKEPIQIEASELQVEDKANTATFTGDVVVTQGEAQLKARKLKVFYDGSGASSNAASQQQISRLEASGSVYISSKDQTATGDQASFDMRQEIMVMTGKEVVLSQGPNVVVGNRLTVNLRTGKADLQAPKSGRVKVLIQPNSLQQQQGN